MSKLYKPLSQLPQVARVVCSAILPNHMQCWRSGDVQVTQTEEAVKPNVTPTTSTYQLCFRHAALEESGQKE